MKHVIIGTAGHVDHGKTLLIKALTGIDTDRLAEAKKRGIRILMDLVVNHSSDQHAWFQAALKDPFGKYGKYYVFREGKDGKEPNNWRSIFGGSAWEKVPGYDNLYYLHIFTKEQPDLNWENQELREEIYEMILKWMDLGLGGFRLDAISHLKKNYQYTNLPPDGPDEYNMAFEYFNNVDGLADILCEMKERTFAPTDALTIGEYDHMGPEDVEDVIGENGSFSSVFDFCHTLDNVRNPKWGNTVALFDDYRDQLFAAQKIDGRSRSRIAGDDDHFATGTDQPSDRLVRQTADLIGRTRTIGTILTVAQIDERLLRQLAADFAPDRQAAQPRIIYADRPVIHFVPSVFQ